MNVEIGTKTPIFLFWEYLFQIFGILSLQSGVDSVNKNSLALSDIDGYGSGPCWIGSIQNKPNPDPAIKSRTDPRSRLEIKNLL